MNHLAAMEIPMSDYSKTFEWVAFPEGRIRYAGSARGRDEPPIETFAVEISGSVHYGEIKRIFLPDGKSYGIEIVSFGWLTKNWPGVEPDPRLASSFTTRQLADVQSLICRAVAVWDGFDDKPFFLFSTKSHFNGSIEFLEGWALIKDGTDET